MPRTLDPDLLDCLRRENPYTEYRIEISQPDVGNILRRNDQFTQAPSLVSMTPANSLAASARGALVLSPTLAALQSFAGVTGSFDLNAEDRDGTRRYKGMGWTVDPAFSRVTLKGVLAKVERVLWAGTPFDTDFECQVFRVTKTPGVKQSNVGTPQYQSVLWTEYTFTPLLSPAPTLKASAQTWDGSNRATLNFDLTNWGLILENSPARAITPDQVGELPEYLIVVRLAGKPPPGTGHFKWRLDTVSARTVAQVGTFERVWWARENDQDQWVRNAYADVPNITLNVESYPATGQGVYLIDQGAAPGADSSGRVDFQRGVPPGTGATLELSTAGSGGPWTVAKHGDVVSVKQQTYHLRVTLNADASLHATPRVNSMGVEFRIPRDVSVEGVPDLPTREIEMPWPKASIPEGRLRVVRTGSRDYLDVATVLGSTAPAPRLEADIYLASRHPSVTRDKWHRLERMMVTNRVPSATSEEFTLLSYASRLKRKIPQKIESLNSVHTVQAGSTAAQAIVAPALPGTTTTGNEYDGKGYYMRVRQTAAVNTPAGFLATIQGNTSTDRLDFSPALTEALVAGDVVEVHSGVYQTQAVSWSDADPADVWDSVLSLLDIPPERIGSGWLPRGGRPPRVTDIAPGDATTQAKRKITGRLSEQEPGDEVLDQISAILGGVTLELDGGQIVYVQLLPLFDVEGKVTVPLAATTAVFDKRDISSLSTPPGLEKRSTIVSCNYGVPATAASPDSFPSKTTTSVDQDALLWLAQQDLEDYGTTEVPDKITRWLYNSTDAGLYLASTICTMQVRVGSTGLRVFPLTLTEKQPEIVPGDVVVVATDQYTDYDPSTETPLAGPLAIRGVVVGVGREGRQLSLLITGLLDNVQIIQSGRVGPLTGLGIMPTPPVLSASFDSTGQLIINSSGDFATDLQKIAWATGSTPSAATVRAATPIAQQNVSGLATGSVYPAGTTVFIAAFAYSGNGLESTPMAAISVTREGSGTSAPPVAVITPTNGETDDTARLLTFSAVAGSGGGGANITYNVYQKIGFAYETTLYSNPSGPLPLSVSIPRDPRSDKVIRFVVVDQLTGLTDIATYLVPSQRPEVNDAGNASLDDSPVAGNRTAQRASGTGHAVVEEERVRGGGGGYGVPGSAYEATPYYDETGSVPLIDPRTRRIQSGALGPTGIGMDTVETGGDRGSRALDATDKLITGITPATKYADGATTIDGRKPAEAGANVTETHTSADTGAVSGRAAVTVKNEAIAGALADSDLTGFGTSGFIDRLNKRVLLIRDAIAGIDVSGAVARFGYRLVDTGDALKLPATETEYTGGASVQSLKPGEVGANVTETHTSADTAAVSGRAAATVKAEAIAGNSADTDLTAFDTSGYLNRTLKRVLRIRDETAGVDVSGAQARYGVRLVDTGDALKLPASEAEYTGGATVDSLKPAQVGADVTATKTSADTAAVDGTAAATVKGGAVKANTGLDGTGRLQTGVTAGATANDGEAGIESQRAATRKGAFGAGSGVGQTSEEDVRGGGGGYPVPFNKFLTEPFYDSTGSIALIDPTTRAIQTGLKYADGTTGIDSLKPREAGADVTGANTAADTTLVNGALALVVKGGAARGQGGFTNATGGLVSTATDTTGRVIDDVGFRTFTALENSGQLKAATQQRSGTGLKNIANGRYSVGTVVNAQSITYPTNYQNPPMINILGGISYEPASVWGTIAQADANTGLGGLAPNVARQIDEVVAYNVTASTASLRARLRQASATTARSHAYATGAITTDGGTKEVTTTNAPAANDTYTTDFTAQFTSTAVPGKSCSVSGTVWLDYWNGSSWLSVASATYAADDPVNGDADTGLIYDALVATVSGLTATSKFRLRLVTNTGAGSRAYGVDPGNVTYSTTTGDQFASKTPTIGGVDLGIKLSVEVIGAS